MAAHRVTETRYPRTARLVSGKRVHLDSFCRPRPQRAHCAVGRGHGGADYLRFWAISVVLVGRKFSLWATSLVVLLSQGLYHLSLSVMSHPSGDVSGMEHVHHAGRNLELAQNITAQYANVHTESMLYAHVLAAIASVVVLNGGERLLKVLGSCLTLSTARRILARIRVQAPAARPLRAYFPLRFQLKLAQLGRLPERRGPPCFILAA